MTTSDLLSVLPHIVLVSWACVLLLVDVLGNWKRYTASLAALGLITVLLMVVFQQPSDSLAFNGMVAIDGFSQFLNILFLASGLVAIALSKDYITRMGYNQGEYYIILLFSISGMMLMAVATDLIVMFLALELLSIPLYVLAGFARPKLESEEAALKYFLLGAFAGGFVVYGIALVFGASGSTSLAEIAATISSGTFDPLLLSIGAALILIGFGFKVAVVPFHMWTPDVYQGAPSSVTAFMAIGAKAAGFAALFRIFVSTFPSLTADLTPVIWVLAALTMVVGNVIALSQTNIKRLLAYSSIAHAGYILMALVPFGQRELANDSVSSALFYLLAYAITNMGSWGVVIALERAEDKGLNLEDYAGLGKKYPGLAAAMAVFMLSFTGIPPTLGFLGKFYLFRTVLQGGFIGLALVGVLTSLISAYYYLRVLVFMYMKDGEPDVQREPLLRVVTATAAIGTVLLSIFAVPLFNWVGQAALSIF